MENTRREYASPHGQVSDSPSHREMSPEEVGGVLEAHRRWAESEGKEGQKANLRKSDLQQTDLAGASLQQVYLIGANLRQANLVGANLQQSHLAGANLQWARLARANLQQANLSRANLQQATLDGVNLREAALSEASLQEASLQNADLTGTQNLLGRQLAGANVSGARLPENIDKFEELKIVEETSRNTRKLFLSMQFGCLYIWLTIATTQDIPLLTNSATSPLPLIGTTIPIVGFYLATPFLLVGVYFYFHLYLQRLWEDLADLPAVFPDGRPLDKRAYPWLLLGLVRAHFRLLRDDRPPLSRLQEWISIVLAWWVVPVTLFLLWGRYLRRHDWLVTSFHIVLLVVAIAGGVVFYRLAVATLRREAGEPFFWREKLKGGRIFRATGMVLSTGILLCFISLGVLHGPAWVPNAFSLIGYSPFLNLREADFSIKPDDWTGEDPTKEIAFVKGVDLKGRNLRYATLSQAFLAKADLREADLQGTDLREANLVEANLQGANLQGADLRKARLALRFKNATGMGPPVHRSADLSGANFTGADLRGVDMPDDLQGVVLRRANLQDVNFSYSNLQGANLHVNLQGANLQGANLQGADLGFAGLQGTDLRGARGLTKEQLQRDPEGGRLGAESWPLAYYDHDFLTSLGLPPDWYKRLQEKDLSGLDLQQADFSGADLRGFNLRGANLFKARLFRADLRGANLRQADLREAYLGRAQLKGTDLRQARMTGYRADVQTDWDLANVYSAELPEGTLNALIESHRAVSVASDEEWEAMKKAAGVD